MHANAALSVTQNRQSPGEKLIEIGAKVFTNSGESQMEALGLFG